MMQKVNRVILIAVAALLVSGCASRPTEHGYARHPELKSGKSARGSSRQQAAPEPPRILPETNYAAGRVFEQQGAPDKAIEQYRKAIAVNHDYTAAYARLGLMLSVTGQHEESVAAFTRAVELKPGSPILRNNLGFELLYVERFDEAERHLREAARIDSKLAQAHINLGILLGRTQRYEQAVDSFRKVLPEPDAYYNLGLLQRAQGRHSEAAESLRHVLTINPEFTAAQRQLVQVERKIAAAQAATDVQAKFAVGPGNDAITVQLTDGENDRPTEAAATAAPIIDLSALIQELITEPSTQKSNSTATTPARRTEGPTAAVPAPQPVLEPAPSPVAIAELEPTPALEDYKTSEEFLEIPATREDPVQTVEARRIAAPQWDLTMADLARALNVADNQQRCLDELQAHTTQPGPIRSVEGGTYDGIVGPPSPANEDVVLVLGTSETRVPLIESKLADRNPPPTLQGIESLKSMDQMEVSIQIIRNEIECQKEYGASNAETSNPRAVGDELPSEFTPIEPQMINANQRTDTWNIEFRALDNLLDVVRNESTCLEGGVFAYGRTPEQRSTEAIDPAAPAYFYGPALFAPPATTPRIPRREKTGQ